MVPIESMGDSLPKWKKAFLPQPSISIRKGYASGYDPPFENTSTLVLTARSGRFVDIRLPIELLGVSERSESLLASHPAFWAFTGTCKTTFISDWSTDQTSTPALEFACAGHTVWTHDIDTKGPGVEDQADMFLLANGDTMEVGFGVESTTGKFEMYKEYWSEPESHGGLQRSTHDTQAVPGITKLPGLAIRIGSFCQGIFEYTSTNGNSVIVVERWERVDPSDHSEESGTWARDSRSNSTTDEIPCQWIIRMNEKPRVGDSFTSSQGARWGVVEVE